MLYGGECSIKLSKRFISLSVCLSVPQEYFRHACLCAGVGHLSRARVHDCYVRASRAHSISKNKKPLILNILEDVLGVCKGVCNVIFVLFRRKVTHVVCENLSGKKAHEALSTFSAQHYVRSEWITDSIQRGCIPNVLSVSAPA
jgi:hypothetical protein